MSADFVTNAEFKSGLEPVITDFVEQTGYGAISADSRELFQAGNIEALFVPAVKFMLDGTLSILNQPEVEEKLPREVAERMDVATYCAARVAEVGTKANLFLLIYAENGALSDLRLDLGEAVSLLDEEYLSSIGRSPFFDVCLMAGGAHRVLKGLEIAEAPSDVVTRSKGLLAITGVHKGFSKRATDFLGRPYAHMQHFRQRQGEDGIELTVTDTVKKKLAKLHIENGGCPAGKIASPEHLGQTALEDYWAKLVDYLLPEDATTDIKV